MSTSGVSSPVRDSHSPAALTTPGDLRQVLKLIALIWAKGIIQSNEHPHKATLGIAPPFRQIPERIPLPVQLSQGDHTGAKGSDMVSIEHMSLIFISFNCLEITKEITKERKKEGKKKKGNKGKKERKRKKEARKEKNIGTG